MNFWDFIINLFMKFIELVANKLPTIINEGFQTMKKAGEVLKELITVITNWLQKL